MNKTKLIIKREYLTRVRKKSFLVMTFLTPLLMAALIIVPVWIATMEDTEVRHIAVVDQTNQFDQIPSTEYMKFEYIENGDIEQLKSNFFNSDYYALLHIPAQAKDDNNLKMYSDIQPGIDIKIHISRSLEQQLEHKNLQEKGINPQVIEQAKEDIALQTIKLTEDGKEEASSTEIAMALGFIAAIMIYMFVFIYGAQVMRGVIEEKTGRVVEILISSVRPFQLMMGKIVGVALVALTQFLLWVVLTAIIVLLAQSVFFSGSSIDQQALNQSMIQGEQMEQIGSLSPEMSQTVVAIMNLPFGLLIGSFIFYFLGGYLLYASLFGAIGAAVDNETDTQQFMLPITIPLILAFVVAQVVVQNPEGAVSFWFSIIPFTSPIIMMVRVAFGVPVWELILSMLLLVLTFIGTTWVAAKIYRTGILMYGKKVNYKELWKWLRYRN